MEKILDKHPQLMKYAKSHSIETHNPFRGRPRRHGFDWNKNGKDWANKYQMCKDGCKQSPIDLKFHSCQVSEKLGIKLSDYHDIPKPAQV